MAGWFTLSPFTRPYSNAISLSWWPTYGKVRIFNFLMEIMVRTVDRVTAVSTARHFCKNFRPSILADLLPFLCNFAILSLQWFSKVFIITCLVSLNFLTVDLATPDSWANGHWPTILSVSPKLLSNANSNDHAQMRVPTATAEKMIRPSTYRNMGIQFVKLQRINVSNAICYIRHYT